VSGGPYRPAWWVPGRHLRTIWGKIARPGPRIPLRVERWQTDDGDFLELHRLDTLAASGTRSPRLIILHGLEGSPRSHYVRGLVFHAQRRGWGAEVLVFRSCGSELNKTARFYHSGETGDLAYVVRRLLASDPDRPLLLAGISLGGNVLLKWLGEQGDNVPMQVLGAAAVSVPYDLARCAQQLERGFSRVYQASFLRSLRRKAEAKHARFPDLYHRDAYRRARTLYEFDDAVTAPVHGFRDAADYYARSSSIRWLSRIRLPTLLLSAADDPFLPADVLREVRELARGNPHLVVEFVDRGGHAGFIGGRHPLDPDYYGERRAAEFLADCLERVVTRTVAR